MSTTAPSANADEIKRFAALAARWWDENGPMRPLHLMRAPRLDFIHAELKKRGKALKGLAVLDIGCGAGLMSETLAKEGASVLGLDASAELVDAAQSHGKGIKNLSYRYGTAEELAEERARFDLVLALEVIEHVNAPGDFVKSCAGLVKKDGLLILSTLNRTPKSFLTTIIAAEYVLRMIPRGTHSFSKFIKPSELGRMLRNERMTVQTITGLVFNPFSGCFSLDESNVAVDYLLSAHF